MKNTVGALIALVTVVFCLPESAMAGGVDNKQNWSASYAGGPSRNGAIEGADIAAYNPAGIMQLKNGLTCAIDTQFISINYDHTIAGTDYSNEESPIVPSFFGIYKKNKWAVYGTFTIPGGGGEVEYDQGNIITQQVSNQLYATAVSLQTGTATPVSLGNENFLSSQYAYVESYDYGFTAGIAYALSDQLSFSAGIRRVITEKSVDIRGTNAAVGGEIIAQYEQEAEGWGGAFGLNYRPSDSWNFALRYETRVNLDWDTTIPSGTNTMGEALLTANNRVEGGSYARDLPAVLGLGAQWAATKRLTILPSVTYYFEKDADWGSQNFAVDHNSFDIAVAFAYQINEKWTATCGYMYSENGIEPENYGIIEQMSPPLDCNTFSVGGEYRATDRLTFKLGLMGSFYLSETAAANPDIGAPETEYSKTNYVGAVSVEYRFL